MIFPKSLLLIFIILLSGVIGDEAGDGQPCNSNASCNTTQSCFRKDANQCDSTNLDGKCITIPSGCLDEWKPVCTCEGGTYPSYCLSLMAGYSIKNNCTTCELLNCKQCTIVPATSDYVTCSDGSLLPPKCNCDGIWVKGTCPSSSSPSGCNTCTTIPKNYYYKCRSGGYMSPTCDCTKSTWVAQSSGCPKKSSSCDCKSIPTDGLFASCNGKIIPPSCNCGTWTKASCPCNTYPTSADFITCDCLKNLICPTCSSGTWAKADPSRCYAIDSVIGQSGITKVISTKPNVQCPLVSDVSLGTCVDACTSDSDCGRNQKCCSNGCGHNCTRPVTLSKPCSDCNLPSSALKYLASTFSQGSWLDKQLPSIAVNKIHVTADNNQLALVITFNSTQGDCSDTKLANTKEWILSAATKLIPNFDSVLFSTNQTYANNTCSIVVSLTGCPKDAQTHNCLINPCDSIKCTNLPNATCVPNYCGGCNVEYFNKDSNGQLTSAKCVKAGQCPKPTGIGFCLASCSSDSDCPGAEKCCSNGCGIICMAPKTAQACSEGDCCNKTTKVVMDKNIVCRAAKGVCDAVEFCTGTSPYCPTDRFLFKGSKCTSGSKKGKCTGTSATKCS